MDRKIIDLDQGWDYMQKGITKLKNILEGLPEKPFCSEEYIMLYTYPFCGTELLLTFFVVDKLDYIFEVFSNFVIA